MDTMPWWKSDILRAQIAMGLVALLGLFGVSTDLADAVPKIVEVVFAIVPLLITLYTIVSRLFKPMPPITQKAAEIERTMIVERIEAGLPPAALPVSDNPASGGQL